MRKRYKDAVRASRDALAKDDEPVIQVYAAVTWEGRCYVARGRFILMMQLAKVVDDDERYRKYCAQFRKLRLHVGGRKKLKVASLPMFVVFGTTMTARDYAAMPKSGDEFSGIRLD